MIWNEHHECMGREELAALQGERLRQMVERIWFNVPFYRNRLQEMGIEPGDIRTIEDLRKLPFTTKQDLPRQLPVRAFRRTPGGRCALPRIQRHHRQVYRRGLHPQ